MAASAGRICLAFSRPAVRRNADGLRPASRAASLMASISASVKRTSILGTRWRVSDPEVERRGAELADERAVVVIRRPNPSFFTYIRLSSF